VKNTPNSSNHSLSSDYRLPSVKARSHHSIIEPSIERVQALADISRSALNAFAVYKVISFHTCILS